MRQDGLGDATKSLEFLLETDSYKANERAIELLNINNQRKDMTEQGTKLAISMLEQSAFLLQGQPPETGVAALSDKVLVLYLPDLHESLVGIIAGRIKEKILPSGTVIYRQWGCGHYKRFRALH